MPLNSKTPQYLRGKSRFDRHKQITESHCGPAVVQMLFEAVGIKVSQEKITKAANAEDTIETKGTRIDQLAIAVEKLFPEFSLLYQLESSLKDLDLLINICEIPVAVEWQGVFEDPEEEDEEGDYGHYSIVSHIDIDKKRLIIVDPYKDFIDQDRIFTFGEFNKRWWDSNEYIDDFGKAHFIVDQQLLFIIAHKNEKLPANLNLLPGIDFKPLE